MTRASDQLVAQFKGLLRSLDHDSFGSERRRILDRAEAALAHFEAGHPPDVMVCSGEVLLRLRPDLAGTVFPGKVYRVADADITEELA